MSEGCREQCARGGEPLAGSAGQDALHLGIAWPKTWWHPEDAHRSSGLPAELAGVLAEAKAERRGLKLRLFQREGDARRDAVELVAAGRGLGVRIGEVPLGELAACVRAVARGEIPAGAEPLGREIFVCTDGKHDRCCAEFGFALYRELLREAAGRGSSVHVAESSHLGGHRFAANCLVLPGLELYGRVERSHAAALLDAVEQGRVLHGHLRGRLGSDELCQIADAWLRAAHPELTPDGTRILEQDGDAACVEVCAGARRFALRCATREFVGAGSCGDPPETRRRWVVEGLA